MQYLDRAMTALRDLGVAPPASEDAPVVALLQHIAGLDADRVAVIARTLTRASVFNEVVRDEISGMAIGDRYADITRAFDSIRDDAKTMIDQIGDGQIDLWERATSAWMKLVRGDVADRFERIRETYLAVTRDTRDQVDRERRILEAYRDYRGALKQAEVMALEVLAKAETALDAAKARVRTAGEAVAGFAGSEPAERARLELARDEAVRAAQDEERRYQVAKDLADNLTIGANTSEVIMARLMQTTNAKERVFAQAVSFFSTNEAVLTALKATFTGTFGLHEATAAVEAMKEGISRSVEVLSEIGGTVQEAAVRAGYGPTIRADAVRKLIDSIVTFQERSREIVDEMRANATRNSTEIRDAVEDGRRRLARLVAEASVPASR